MNIKTSLLIIIFTLIHKRFLQSTSNLLQPPCSHHWKLSTDIAMNTKTTSSKQKKITSSQLSMRAILGIIGPWSWQCRLSVARSVLKQARANIPQHDLSKQGWKVIYYTALRPNLLIWIFWLSQKNSQVKTVSAEMICFAKFVPSKNPLEYSNLPQDYHAK